METISFEEFKKLEIKIGKILSAEKVEGSEKLLKLMVDFGTEPETAIPIKRQIIAGIAQFYAPEALIGKECPFAYNLAPRVLAGLESQGMLLCPSDSVGPALLHPDKEIPPGSLVK
jgi:methionine--tRNA ligase beta chain